MFIDNHENIKSESSLQIAIIEYCREIAKTDKVVSGIGDVFHVPNGGQRSIRTAMRLKAEGVRKGVPDLLWLVPNDDYYGLALELKWAHGRASKEQKDWIKRHRERGYCCEIANGLIESLSIINEYFSINYSDEIFGVTIYELIRRYSEVENKRKSQKVVKRERRAKKDIHRSRSTASRF